MEEVISAYLPCNVVILTSQQKKNRFWRYNKSDLLINYRLKKKKKNKKMSSLSK
jgi:uncharacterized protein (DUF302 family)